jgi:hypothetical protein
MNTYTVILSYHNGKRSFVDKMFLNITADNLIQAGELALAKWNKPNAVINMCWCNWSKA